MSENARLARGLRRCQPQAGVQKDVGGLGVGGLDDLEHRLVQPCPHGRVIRQGLLREVDLRLDQMWQQIRENLFDIVK